MEIRLSEVEITAGVVAYLNSRGFNLDASTVKIDFTVGRKPAGVTAILVEGGNPIPPVPPAPIDAPVVTDAQAEQRLKPQADTAGASLPAEDLSPAPADPAPEVAPEEAPDVAPADTQPAPTEATESLFK